LLHASGNKVDQGAYLFTGLSGAGKSTAMNLMQQKSQPVADDTIIIRRDRCQHYVYQTPFFEKQSGIPKNQEKILLKKIFFLKKGHDLKLIPLKNSEIILSLLTSQLITQEENRKRTIETLIKFTKEFKYFFQLCFSKKSPLHLR